MYGWHLSVILICLDIMQAIFAVTYARPRTSLASYSGAKPWQMLLLTSLLAATIAAIPLISERSLFELMTGWHFMIFVISIAVSLLGMALFYFRPRATLEKSSAAAKRWRSLFGLSSVLLITGIVGLVIQKWIFG